MRNPVLVGVSSVLCFFGIAAAQEMYETAVDRSNDASTERTMDQGRQIFRFDTFGDESFWGDTLGLHKAIEGANLGGVGGGVSPTTALAVGLKVDVDALPPAVIEALKQGQVDLNSPATTLTLVKLNSVVGVTGFAMLQSLAFQVLHGDEGFVVLLADVINRADIRMVEG